MRCITIPEAAELIGVSVSMLYRLCRENKILHVRIGGRVLIDEDEIDEILDSFKRGPR